MTVQSDANSLPGPFLLECSSFDELISLLRAQGRTVIAPVLRDGAIDLGPIETAADLPWGWTEKQDAGRYRLKRDEERRAFHFANGPSSLKRYLHPPERRLWRARRNGTGFCVEETEAEVLRYAFLGIRACDLAALGLLDRIFLTGGVPDPYYASVRKEAIFIAVNCTTASSTCFCASMKSGPRATQGHDLVLTELADENRHNFLMEIATVAGANIARALTKRKAKEADTAQAREISIRVAASQSRAIETDGLRERLLAHPQDRCWNAVAERCLTCGNCTMVCPTCFCTTVEDRTAIDGSHAERRQLWDSCFSLDFSYMAGGAVRQSGASRYRQWLTHKLSTWVDQFDAFGCVGCGRCITWCPVGIDITEEAAKPGSSTGP